MELHCKVHAWCLRRVVLFRAFKTGPGPTTFGFGQTRVVTNLPGGRVSTGARGLVAIGTPKP